MDSLITAAGRALAAGDPLGALKRIALRDDAPALALRGIAMAQLGDLVRARTLLRRAARAFDPKEKVARARCVVAEAEIALAARDLGWSAKTLDAARATLDEHGDRVNASHARYLEVRRLVLIGRLDEAERALAGLDPAALPPASRTVAVSTRLPLATVLVFQGIDTGPDEADVKVATVWLPTLNVNVLEPAAAPPTHSTTQ